MTRDIAPDDSRDNVASGQTSLNQQRRLVAASGVAPPAPPLGQRSRDVTNGRDHSERSPEKDLKREPALRLPTGRQREPVALGAQRYLLRGSEAQTLAAVGTFRTVFARDLGHYENAATRDADVHSLQTQELVDRRTVHVKGEPEPVEVLTLTAAGKRLLESQRTLSSEPDTQQFYAGWVRIRELLHDASLYRMAEAERRRIDHEGGVVRRVVLDHELKAQVYRTLNRTPAVSEDAWEQSRDTLAAAHDLTVTNGHVQFPDVRMEYETAAGERAHVDLELVTEHYHAAHLGGKRAAGFTLYSLGGARSGRAGGTPHDPRRRGSLSR